MKDVKSNLNLLILSIGVISVWRGIWGILETYLFPENQLLSFSVSILFGLLILYFKDHKLNELI